MNGRQSLDVVIEPERYELHADPLYRFDLDRRTFFKVLGCGVVVMLLADESTAQESGRGGFGGGRRQRPAEINAWLHVGEDGIVTVFTGKAEVGQDIRTSLAQRVAEELRTPVDSVRLVMSDTQRVPFDMGTFGSRTTPDMGSQLARVAAAAREALIDLAAEFFQTSRDTLAADNGTIVRAGTAGSVAFGLLTKGQELMKTVTEPSKTRPPQEWTIAGTSVPKVDGAEFVTGRHKYASDIKRPNMLYGRVLRPDAFEATLVCVDTSDADEMEGVTVVCDDGFVGVVAPDAHTADLALAALRAEWATKPQPSSTEIFDYFKKHAGGGGARGPGGGRATGSVEQGLAAADHQLRQKYTIAYIAHVPLEPRAAVAEWAGGQLTVWTGTQRPFGVRGELAQAFGLTDDQIRVIVPDTGSGYGGKHTGEAAVEAARLAKAVGRPVKLVWTREEEFTSAYVRPAGVVEVASGVRNDGTITAWEFHNFNSGGSAIEPPYAIANQRNAFHACPSPLRQGSYRALAATANHFAREVHIDELADLVKIDPLEFRLKNLKDERLRAVLEAAAKAFGWGGKPRIDHGFGISAGLEKGSFIGTCAEVFVDRTAGTVRVERVTAAFDCGAVVNPEHLKNQIEGAIVMGLGGAMFEAIEFENGRMLNPNFSGYQVPRFRDAPQIEVLLLDRKDRPSIGAGETPIVGIAPAISNAIFQAAGVRLRSLPMVPQRHIL